MRRRFFPLLLLTLAAVGLAQGCSPSEEANYDDAAWERFRGPNGSGVSEETNLPVYWDKDGSGVRWQVEVPTGVSSPIVSGSQVILTAETVNPGRTTLRVISLDLKDGKKRWETEVFTRKREKFSVRSVVNSSAGPTPATDGEHIYAYFGSHLASLDLEGKVIWLEEIDPNYLKEIRYGAGSSVVLSDTNVFILRDQEETGRTGWLAAYDKQNGKRQWRRKWQDTCCSYTTPILLERESKTQLIVALARKIEAFDPETGKRLWHRPQVMNQPVGSPVLMDDFLCSATGAHGVKDTSCWQLDFEKPVKRMAKRLWRARKGINSIASPLLYNGILFSMTDKGVLYAFDPSTGKPHWVSRLSAGPYVASLVAGDDKLYALSRRGNGSVIAAGPQYQLLAENTMPGPDVVASPAIAGGCLLVRSEAHLTCIEGAESPVEAEPAA